MDFSLWATDTSSSMNFHSAFKHTDAMRGLSLELFEKEFLAHGTYGIYLLTHIRARHVHRLPGVHREGLIKAM